MFRPNAHAAKLLPKQQDSSSNRTNNRIKQRKLPRNNNSKLPFLPFSLLAFIMVIFMLALGMFGLYTMLYFTSISDTSTSHVQRKAAAALVPNEALPKRSIASKAQSALQFEAIRNEFDTRYGGHVIARRMLANGVKSYGDIDVTARRILLARHEHRPFTMAFSGYSITVGRGNYFQQSFPFVMERLLKKPMADLLGTDLVVRNGAIGGIPSFPYAFCLEHFLGPDPDVISWDYSMNEGPKDSSVLEAWLRQATQQLSHRPMVIMVDTNPVRTGILDQYTKQGLLKDAVSISKKDTIEESLFQQDPPPPGLEDWDEFGAPKGCPGRGNWHPKKMEHEYMGWLLAMHFVDAMERAVELVQDNPEWEHELEQMIVERQHEPHFPPPLSSSLPQNDETVTELLYGHGQDGNAALYRMKDLSCRTSFLPATDNEKVIPSIVVSGMAEQGEMDIMVDRTDEMYAGGWVLDVSTVERVTKRKVEACGGLGYVDMKVAMYGTAESGPLKLWLPFEKSHDVHDEHEHEDDTSASHWFDDLILCEANERRKDEACKLDRDLEIRIDGILVPTEEIAPIKGAGEYLKRTTCVNVPIPKDAKVTAINDVQTFEGQPVSEERKRRLSKIATAHGLSVEITPRGNVKRDAGACCLSHIVWEQH